MRKRKAMAGVMAGLCCASMCGCSLMDQIVGSFSGESAAMETPVYTLEPVPYETFDQEYLEEAETPSPVNLGAVERFASVWNASLEGVENLQLVPQDAIAAPAEGMLIGGQILEYPFSPGSLYLYVIEGQLVGARMATNTNAWADAEAPRDWGVCWKTMIQSVNGNWADAHYVDIINSISEGFPPAGQETGTIEGPVVTDNGWVYEMINEDLGYSVDKEVSAWVAQFAGAHS